jgi:hypothetical protein
MPLVGSGEGEHPRRERNEARRIVMLARIECPYLLKVSLNGYAGIP